MNHSDLGIAPFRYGMFDLRCAFRSCPKTHKITVLASFHEHESNDECAITTDPRYGNPTPNGSWSGVIGLLSRGETDMSSMGLALVKTRAEVIDFVFPLYDYEQTALVLKKNRRVFNVWAYLSVFTLPTWITVGVSSLILTGSFFALRYSIPASDANTWTLKHSVWHVFLALLQKSEDIPFSNLTLKVLMWFTGIFFCVIFAAYNADITTSLTVLQADEGISSFYDFLDGHFVPSALKGGYWESVFKDAKPPSIYHKLYEERVRDNPMSFLPLNPLIEAIKKEEVILLGPELMPLTLTYLEALKLPETLRSPTSAGLRKDSEFYEIFSFYSLKMRQSGIVNKMVTNLFADEERAKRSFVFEAQALNYESLLFPFLVLIIGVILCFSTLALEAVVGKLSNHDGI